MESFKLLAECIQGLDGKLMVTPAAAENAINLAVDSVERMEGYNPDLPLGPQLPDYEAVLYLASEIVRQASLSADEKKASGSPQPSPVTPGNSNAGNVKTATDAHPGSVIQIGPAASGDPVSTNGGSQPQAEGG